jgi:type IV secretory pathway VirB2 component (pilin)
MLESGSDSERKTVSTRFYATFVYHPFSISFNYKEKHSMDLSTAIEDLMGDVQGAAQTIAPLVAVIGFIGLGVMYMGSSWPIVGDWKKDNPKAANQVVVGLLFVIFASSVTTLISF